MHEGTISTEAGRTEGSSLGERVWLMENEFLCITKSESGLEPFNSVKGVPLSQ